MDERYPEEDLTVVREGYYEADDDGTMPGNVEQLREAVVGHKIVSAEYEDRPHPDYSWRGHRKVLVLTLDTGRKVILRDTDDCCAYTELESFLLHPELVDHAILGVGTTEGFQTWHIYADLGDVMTLEVGWSCGNPFYYGYGFDITVEDVEA